MKMAVDYLRRVEKAMAGDSQLRVWRSQFVRYSAEQSPLREPTTEVERIMLWAQGEAVREAFVRESVEPADLRDCRDAMIVAIPPDAQLTIHFDGATRLEYAVERAGTLDKTHPPVYLIHMTPEELDPANRPNAVDTPEERRTIWHEYHKEGAWFSIEVRRQDFHPDRQPIYADVFTIMRRPPIEGEVPYWDLDALDGRHDE